MTTPPEIPVRLPSKQPSTVLAGPYGHPLHPALVALPIGAWSGSLLLDIGSRVVDDGAALGPAAWWMIALGIGSALVAAIFGLLDYLAIPSGTAAKRTGTLHLALNLAVVALFASSFAIRLDDAAAETPVGPIVISVVALALLGASGWLGGKLAYRYGVRVATESDQADGFLTSPAS